MASLRFAISGKNTKEMVPQEEVLNAEIRCLQKQRLNTLHDTYDILYAKCQSSELGKRATEIQQEKDKYQQGNKKVQEEVAVIKADTRRFLREIEERVKNVILKILLTNKEIKKRCEMKANDLDNFVFAKPKSVREMFPQNLDEEFEKRSVIHRKRPAVPKNTDKVIVSKVTESVFISNGNGSVAAMKDTTITKHKDLQVTSSYKEVIKSNGHNHVSLTRSSELEIKHTPEPLTNSRDPPQLCSNISIHPTNFQKYDYLKSLEATQTNLKQSQYSRPSGTPLKTPSTFSSEITPKRKIVPDNSPNKVEILSLEVMKPADELPSVTSDRFDRYLNDSPLSGTFNITKERPSSNKPRASNASLNMPSLDVDMEAAEKTADKSKVRFSNNFDFDSGEFNMRNENAQPKKLPESKAKNHQPESFDFDVELSTEKTANKNSPGSSNNFNFDTGKYDIENGNSQPTSIPKNQESANIQPKPGPSNNIKKAPAQTTFNLSPPDSMGSFNFDGSKDNFEDFAKGLNFGNDDSDNLNLGFAFNDDQDLGFDNALKMDFTDGDDNNSFCFGADSTENDGGNDDLFHF